MNNEYEITAEVPKGWDIDSFFEMPDDWGVIASGWQWMAWGKLTRKQRLIRWLHRRKRRIAE